MASQDSFVDEVTDAVRRDRLFAAFRKYGWIGVLLVLLIVGGAAFNEWQKAKAAARAESFGDAAMAALEKTGAERATAIAAIPADGDQKALRLLLQATDTTDKPGTLAALDALAADATLPQVYRDLSVLRRVAVAGQEQPLADRRTALQSIAIAGRPFRVLAEEQLAYLSIEDGKPDDALKALTALVQDQEATPGLRKRASVVITALGGTVPTPAKPDAVAPADAG